MTALASPAELGSQLAEALELSSARGWRSTGRRSRCRGQKLVSNAQLRRITAVIPAVESLRPPSIDFIATNNPPKVPERIGNPRLHVRDQSAAAPSVGCVRRAHGRGRTAGRRKIAAGSSPKTQIVERMQPGRIAGRGLGPAAPRIAGVGCPLTPILQRFAQGNRIGRPLGSSTGTWKA